MIAAVTVLVIFGRKPLRTILKAISKKFGPNFISFASLQFLITAV